MRLDKPVELKVDIKEQVSQLSKQISETKVMAEDEPVKRNTTQDEGPSAPPTPAQPIKQQPPKRDKKLEEVLKIASEAPSDEGKKKLRTIAYSSSSRPAQIQAVFALSSWFDLTQDSPKEMVDLCDVGIMASYDANYKSGVAVLLADKARYFTHQLVEVEIDHWYKTQMNNSFGLIVVPPEEIERLRKLGLSLDDQRRKTAVAAMDAAMESNDLRAYGFVLLYAGESAGSLAGVLDRIGDPATGQAQLGLCKKLLVQARVCFERLDDSEGRAYALHNLANMLRGFDEALAKDITRQVIKEAKALKDKTLETQAKLLLKRIETGRVPDYVGGESMED